MTHSSTPSRQQRLSALRRFVLRSPLVLGLALALNVAAQPGRGAIVVIASHAPGVALPSREQIADVFLSRGAMLATPQGVLQPFDAADSQLKSAFYRDIAGMSATRLRAFWAKRVFTGRGEPPPEITVAELPAILSGAQPSITYVWEDAAPEHSVVLYRIVLN